MASAEMEESPQVPGKYLGEQLGAPVEFFLKPPSSGEPKEGCRQKDKGQPRKRAAQRRQREGQREIFCRQTGKSQAEDASSQAGRHQHKEEQRQEDP